MSENILQIGISILVAVITASLTVWLSLRRFYREKWWEAKMQAYTAIIEALHHMKRDLEVSIAAAYDGRDTETEYFKDLDEKNRNAWKELRKQLDVGDFLFSPESVTILQKFFDDANRADDPNNMWVEHLEYLQTATEVCLPAIKVSARKDLKLPPLKVAKC